MTHTEIPPASGAFRRPTRHTPRKAERRPSTSGTGTGRLDRVRARLSSRAATAVALLIAVVWTLPSLGLLVSSFRTPDAVASSGWWRAFGDDALTLDNYAAIFDPTRVQVNLAEGLINSLAITIPGAILPLGLALLAAYAFAWIPFRGRNTLFITVFALQILPVQMVMVPLLRLFSGGEIFGTVVVRPLDGSTGFASIWLAHTILALPLTIFLLHNFVASLPADLFEAARIDGAGHGQIFLRIVLPLAMPAIASIAIFQFLWVWNDLLIALVFSSSDQNPITVMLTNMVGTQGQNTYLLSAAAFISIIIPLGVFLGLQRYFVRGLLAGATKG
ncbi:carbohydrate ABC transporter permease [Mycetocola tolaasinivorans]|uniref:Carbohydrate ABC transporter permease n=1 Tax=Mycetocola tolaasinivorans TaxID=76635 RepID=A0A3L7A251_9MICO|nr:carbohydrate ABC transporter permease [Mycetocola tolaasinivorans]RLP74078.1 carbohydrate ABC transporter permease [Mycetocola tolaasinivorans]